MRASTLEAAKHDEHAVNGRFRHILSCYGTEWIVQNDDSSRAVCA
jgi:hypothetical protein